MEENDFRDEVRLRGGGWRRCNAIGCLVAMRMKVGKNVDAYSISACLKEINYVFNTLGSFLVSD